ncbi:sialic acid O-acetyltransferase [Chromatium okenii]|jgi:sugar O-acyltransferase (sialic acid O-acetyltransferase NeuD family)|uniref:Sialic acid O-acetyltransferase n=1 Tax=Chromatium okenii TaxID=61644 RepID=A0A2S7XUQ1_9GAMM|nr:sialic acid O-acetyltransferase [Chromatium okenii]MBV5310572.1 hypothetical protein [Chromatium okenii]PQJ97474.1 sialic acid O-acetyltransferase [Chromatium okenii]
MNQQRVIIFGGKGTAINIAEQIEDARLRFGYPMSVVGFAIDESPLNREIAGFSVLCGVKEAWTKYHDTDVKFIFSLYRPDVMMERLTLLRALKIPVIRFANFIHPSAYVSPNVKLGYGNVILSHSCLQHNVSLGNYNIINSHVVIEHETVFQDGSFVAANACVGARVQIGTGSFIGLSATIREDIFIGNYTFIGMGAGVLQSVDNGSVVYGLPARQKG